MSQLTYQQKQAWVALIVLVPLSLYCIVGAVRAGVLDGTATMEDLEKLVGIPILICVAIHAVTFLVLVLRSKDIAPDERELLIERRAERKAQSFTFMGIYLAISTAFSYERLALSISLLTLGLLLSMIASAALLLHYHRSGI